jgi:hypothetical protein
MLEAIMLGEIPGTSFQISFSGWLLIIAALLSAFLVIKISIRHLLVWTTALRAQYLGRKAFKLLTQHHLL